METRSFPFLPIISPRLRYFDRLDFTLPRTILRNRCRSFSIFCPTAGYPRTDGRGTGLRYRNRTPRGDGEGRRGGKIVPIRPPAGGEFGCGRQDLPRAGRRIGRRYQPVPPRRAVGRVV